MFGYRYDLVPGDSEASYYIVILTNGVNIKYQKPNATQILFPDGSYLVTDNQNNSYFFSNERMNPNIYGFRYHSSDFNKTWKA